MTINQPTVLVKKADGTFVRMTLDEVKKMKLPVKEIKAIIIITTLTAIAINLLFIPSQNLVESIIKITPKKGI